MLLNNRYSYSRGGPAVSRDASIQILATGRDSILSGWKHMHTDEFSPGNNPIVGSVDDCVSAARHVRLNEKNTDFAAQLLDLCAKGIERPLKTVDTGLQ